MKSEKEEICRKRVVGGGFMRSNSIQASTVRRSAEPVPEYAYKRTLEKSFLKKFDLKEEKTRVES